MAIARRELWIGSSPAGHSSCLIFPRRRPKALQASEFLLPTEPWGKGCRRDLWEWQTTVKRSCPSLTLGDGCCSSALVCPALEHAWDCTRRESSFVFNPWCRINPKQIVLMKGSVDLFFDLGGLLLDLFGVWVIKISRLADSALVMTLIWSLCCSIPNPLVRLEQVNLSETFA